MVFTYLDITAEDDEEMKLCMIGTRGHYGYVLDDLAKMPDVELVGLYGVGQARDLGDET